MNICLGGSVDYYSKPGGGESKEKYLIIFPKSCMLLSHILQIGISQLDKMDVGFIAKATLFKWPFGWFFKALGGIPVDRSRALGFIDSVVKVIKAREKFSTAIAPEGTRGKVKRLKTGFYHIARLADIPLVYVKFDWGNKIIAFAEPRKVKDTIEEELEFIEEHFKNTVGRNPEKSYGYPFKEK